MQPVIYWCIGSLLFVLGIVVLTIALLRYGGGDSPRNKYLAELFWQARNPNTDWWLDIHKHDK
jgi:hypothetical protein